jgi:acetyl esterase/lipase
MPAHHDDAQPDDVLTRKAGPPDAVLRYGGLRDHVIDLRLPATTDNTANADKEDGDARPPLVVVIHGGFWRDAFDRTHTGPQCEGLAAAGYAVAAIEYRRTTTDSAAPDDTKGGWPATFDDVAAALDALPDLVDDATHGRVDTSRIVLVGHSAGGHLALWVAARHRLPAGSPWRLDAPMPGVAGVVALAAVSDLAACYDQHLGSDAVVPLLGGGPADFPDRYAAADPAGLLPTGARAVLVHGVDDDRVPVSMSESYATAARKAGDDVSLVALPGCGHFEVIDPLSAAWPAVLDAVRQLTPITPSGDVKQP